MVFRILSGRVVFLTRVVQLLNMPIMHMVDSNQSLVIGPGNLGTSPMPGDRKDPYKNQDPKPQESDLVWWDHRWH